MTEKTRARRIVCIREDLFLFSELFEFRPHALVNFVGGGGKTSLMHKLAEELCSQGPVLCTATTRIHPPDPSEGFAVISSNSISLLHLIVQRIGKECENRPFKLAVARQFISPNMMKGVSPDFDDKVNKSLFSILLNEADGAAGYSIKLPEEYEPVPMQNAEYLVPVIGLDCLHQSMGPKAIFRWNALADHFSLHEGDTLIPETAAGILMHPQGVCRSWKPGEIILPFINKVDEPAQDAAARDLAAAILRNPVFPVERVLFGSILRGRAESVSSP
jgi:probable selenium-dependent hydroxylase accessory protein YqeC